MRLVLVLFAFAVSCAPPRATEPSEALAEGGEAVDDRTFGALVASPPLASEKSCLLVETHDGLALGVPLVSAVNPRPGPPTDLGRRLTRESHGVTLFTLYGQFGDGGVPLAAITRHAPPLGPFVAIYLTSAGAHIAAPGRDTAGPLPDDELDVVLSRIGVDSSYLVAVVPADETAPMVLAAVLRTIDARGAEPTLALPLPEGTRHRRHESEPDHTGMCGSSDTSAPRGELSMPAIRAGIAGLGADVRACRAQSSGYEAARGGILGLFVRVGADGRVAIACVDEDTIGDAALRACVLGAARSLVFEAPDPSGFVDLRLPLRVERDVSERTRGLCSSR
jgi:hypothetical protein